VYSFIRDALAEAVGLVLPITCGGCGVDDRALCESCLAPLVPAVISRRLPDGLAVHSGLAYEGVVRRVVLALKEQQRTDLARHLAPALVAAVADAVAVMEGGPSQGTPPPLRLVPVPGSRAAYRRRGYDPVRLLLARAGYESLRAFAPARPHAAQKGLGIDDREANLAGAFRLRVPVRGIRLLLIDDVVTTGSTLAEAARALRRRGRRGGGCHGGLDTPVVAPHGNL